MAHFPRSVTQIRVLCRYVKLTVCFWSFPDRARVVQGLPDVATIMEDKVILSNCHALLGEVALSSCIDVARITGGAEHKVPFSLVFSAAMALCFPEPAQL